MLAGQPCRRSDPALLQQPLIVGGFQGNRAKVNSPKGELNSAAGCIQRLQDSPSSTTLPVAVSRAGERRGRTWKQLGFFLT